MNWHAVAIVAFIACVIGDVIALSTTMASFEYDPYPKPLLYVALVAASLTSTALLAGVVW